MAQKVKKPSLQTRAAQKTKAAVGKAKEAAKGQAMAKAIETHIEGDAAIASTLSNVVNLPAITTQPKADDRTTEKKPSLVDVDVDGGMLLDPATEGNKASARLYKPTADNIAAAERLATMPPENFNAELQKLGLETTTLQFRVALHCVVIAYRLQKEGDKAMQFVHNFMDSLSMLGKGTSLVRTDAIKTWLLTYSALVWAAPAGKDAKEFMFDKGKRSAFAGEFSNNRKGWISKRLSKPFWILTPEKDFQEYSLPQKLAMLLKQAEAIAKLSEADKKSRFGDKPVDLTLLPELRKAVKKAGATIPDDTAAPNEDKAATG